MRIFNFFKKRQLKKETSEYPFEFYLILSLILSDYFTIEYVIKQYKEWRAFKTLQKFESFFIKWVNGNIDIS